MRLKKFKAVGIHDALNINVNFNEQITLLVGINGSGKTTVLNMTSWLLSLKFGSLLAVGFDELTLTIVYEGRDLTIEAVRHRERLEITLEGHAEKFSPILVHFPNLNYRPDPEDADQIDQLNNGLQPDADERPLWEFIMGLPKINNITLERVLSIDDGQSSYYSSERRGLIHRRAVATPMQNVNTIIADVASALRVRMEKIDTELTRDLLLSSFMPRGRHTEDVSLGTMSEIASNIYKIEQMLNGNLGIHESNLGLADYFKELRFALEAISKPTGPELLKDFIYLQSEMLRLRNVSQAFDRAQQAKSYASWKWDRYLETLNNLFEDSGKLIELSENGQRLNFKFLNGVSEKSQDRRGVDGLSSGEKQLLILLTYVAFPQNGSKIIIIDEPELSLHLRWQEKFLEAVLPLADKNLQLIIATHSPAIVGRNKNYCVPMPRMPQGRV